MIRCADGTAEKSKLDTESTARHYAAARPTYPFPGGEVTEQFSTLLVATLPHHPAQP